MLPRIILAVFCFLNLATATNTPESECSLCTGINPPSVMGDLTSQCRKMNKLKGTDLISDDALRHCCIDLQTSYSDCNSALTKAEIDQTFRECFQTGFLDWFGTDGQEYLNNVLLFLKPKENLLFSCDHLRYERRKCSCSADEFFKKVIFCATYSKSVFPYDPVTAQISFSDLTTYAPLYMPPRTESPPVQQPPQSQPQIPPLSEPNPQPQQQGPLPKPPNVPNDDDESCSSSSSSEEHHDILKHHLEKLKKRLKKRREDLQAKLQNLLKKPKDSNFLRNLFNQKQQPPNVLGNVVNKVNQGIDKLQERFTENTAKINDAVRRLFSG